uniref:Pectate lyase n=1 Tax=viral metagenome TaxID=1070528 RepID=A0A6H1ZX65_9ZZZZ
MSITRFPHGLSSFGIPLYGSGVGPIFGPGCGNIKYVVTTKASTDLYYVMLEEHGVSLNDIYTTLASAYAATTASQNDVIAVCPGAYDETATLDWTKDNTHLVGLGGPNTMNDYSEKNVVIYTDTSAVDYTIDLTGDHCVFLNIGINNVGNSATNYAAMKVNGYGNYFENVSFIGALGSSQLSAVACGSLTVSTNGHNSRFINCVIGEDCWGARTGSRSGQLICDGSQPNGVVFRDCYFRSQSSTAAVAMVRITPIAIGRGWIFDGCMFYNYGTTNLNQCFASSVNDTTHSWTDIVLKDCFSKGIDKWTDHTVDLVYGNMPIADDGGGQAISLDETVAGGA